MKTDEYLAALEALNLPTHAQSTAEALGVSVPTLARLAAGVERGGKINRTLAKLIRMYLRFGVPAGF
jgi:hypothetical protein